MGWTDCTFTSWPQLRECLSELASTDRVVCRGQGADFDKGAILSSLDRTLRCGVDGKCKAEVEREIARRFRMYAPNYLPIAELQHLGDPPSFWMLMRHYGAPTRLVDWTYSIWVGAYFAAGSDFGRDGVIWVFNGEALDTYADEKHHEETKYVPKTDRTSALPMLMVNRYGSWVCRLMQFGHQIPRMIAQQGLFTVAGQLGVDHVAAIDAIIPDSVASPGKQIIRFDSALKPKVLKALHQMGINGSTLFPGIDGVGRALTEYAHHALDDKGGA